MSGFVEIVAPGLRRALGAGTRRGVFVVADRAAADRPAVRRFGLWQNGRRGQQPRRAAPADPMRVGHGWLRRRGASDTTGKAGAIAVWSVATLWSLLVVSVGIGLEMGWW